MSLVLPRISRRQTIILALNAAALLAACIILARRFWGDPAWRGWGVYSLVAALLWVVFLVAQDVVSTPDPSSPAGLFQRLSFIAGWSWIALIAFALLRKGAPVSQ